MITKSGVLLYRYFHGWEGPIASGSTSENFFFLLCAARTALFSLLSSDNNNKGDTIHLTSLIFL